MADTAALSIAGTAASISLFADSGPTRSRITRIEEQLRGSGSPLSLIEALERRGGGAPT